jgi:metal-responsive CopG/Arc/MetJ family transcriptional regulator
MTKKQLGTITILIKDRQMNSGKMNKLLTDSGHIIMARLGVNIEPLCVEHCTGLIAVAVKASAQEINDLAKKLNKLYGIVAKANIMTK